MFESIGIILELYFDISFFIKSHPQIIASLLAMRIFLLNLIILRVGKRPERPGIAATVISDFFL